MKLVLSILLSVMLSVSVMAQQKIQLRSADKAECVKSDMTSLKASFSFSTIDAEKVNTKGGDFSWISMPNTVLGGNEGDPQIPVINQLIAVPVGAQPTITVTSYSSTDYQLSDLGIETLIPRQPSLRKDQKPEEVPFVYNASAYQTRGMRSEPQAVVSVEGTMRGVQLGKMTIEPVSYDPVSNTLRVFNDIEVEVSFDGADAKATEDLLVETYSPYFDIVYKSLFNGRAVLDAYSDHPDLYSTPVKMLVVTTSTFTSSTAFQNWLTWKKQKGIEVDVQEVTSSTTSANVRSLIQSRYNANHPTFLVIVGDESVVKNYTTWTQSSLNYSPYISDNAYASIDSDVYHDMYMSRMAVANTTQLGYLVDKILMYEKYTMSDPSYLNHTLLIAGWDSNWTAIAGKPTINYAANNYFNTANGITPHTYITTASGQTTCYNYMSQVGFINYTAHGDIQEWADPEFTNSNVNSLTNTGKPFWAMGNCCLTANWGNSSYSPCFGETMIRANNKGAFGYIGSIPESYWFEDLYFGVGAFAAQQSSSNNPTVSGTTVGVYDAMFDETGFNCLNAVPYIGNVAVTYAHAKNYNSSVSDEYYWRGYQTLGDGSVMPYLKVPAANNVSLASSTIPAGAASFRVNADGGSYVSITVNNEIIGVAAVPANATYVDVPFTTTPVVGQTAMIVVTRNQRQPYINNNVPIVGGAECTITTNVSPANSGTVTGAGTYYENTECTLEATANHGYVFQKWNDNNTDNPRTITVTGNATYTANFRQLTEHHCTYNPQQTNGTIAISTPSAHLFAGDIVTLIATPAPGFCLDEWFVYTNSKARIPVENNQFVMPDDEVTISATFKSGYTITVADVANGTISADPTSAMAGDLITLSATPDTGYELQCWVVYKTGDATTTMTVTGSTFTMPAYDVTVSAIFNTPTNTEVTIGSGTSTGENLPTNVYYRYSLTQQIYTAAEVGEAGTITAISFYYAGTTVGQRSSMDIYMSHTTSTTLSSWVTESSSNLVFSGGHAFSTGWNTITLDTPFAYNGTSNILLTVDDNTGSYTSSSQSFYTYSTGANRAIYYRNDSNNPSATGSNSYTATTSTSNAQLKLTKVLDVDDNLTVSPTALEGFTYMEAEGPSEAQTITITGHVSNDVTVTAPAHYEVSTALNGTYSNTLTIPAVSSKGNRSTQSWDFEDGFDGWTTIDADGDGNNWTRSSILMAGYSIPSHSGSDGLSSASYDGGALTPDNWLISPQVPLGGSFTMWANAQDAEYPAEHFGIYVSTTGNTNTSDFTLLYETTLTAKGTRSGNNMTRDSKGNRESGSWYDFTVDLSSYADQYGYIAVRHFGCTDQFYLNVDDFSLEYTGTMPVTPTNPDLNILTANVYVRLKADLEANEYNETLTVATGSLSSNVTLSGEVTPNTGTQYTITVVANPTEGGTVAGGGTYYEGSHRDLTATPATHYTFTGWQLNGSIVSTDNPYTITVTGDATYTAVFDPMTEHSITLNQVTGGTISASPAAAYMGDVVTLTATPESGYFFEAWTVVDASNNVITVTDNQFTMPDSDVTVTATFTTGFSITLNQTEHGTISADQTTALAPGTVVTMTATPDAGCVFVAWYAYKTGNPRDVVSVISNQYILMPSSDVTVQAIFVTEEEHEASLGSGTNTNGYIPTYVRRAYSLTQQIYLASELDNQKGRITKIAYRATTTAATRNLTIYMAHTDLAEFSSTTSWEVMGSVAKVFEGNVAFSTSDWTTIILDTPFEYDGTSNINICVVDNTGSTAGSNNRYTQFYRYSGTNRALYVNGSSSYANTVGYSNQLSSTTGTRISYVSQVHITMMVPGSAESLTLSPGEMADFSYVENHGPSLTSKLDIVGVDLQNDITLNAPTNFEICLTEDGTYASSVTVPRETGSKGNRTVTHWGFEGTMDGWTSLDSDNDGNGWVLGSACGGIYLASGNNLSEGHDESTDMLVSGSYSNETGSALTPDNWLISPQINELGGSFSMWAKAQQQAYPAEHFGIYVSTTSTNPSDFTLLDEWTLTSANWKQFSVDLGLYTGQQGYIAVRHFNCTDQFMIDVDDFELDTDASITIEMPVVITPATVYVRMAENLNPGTYSGTLTGSAGTLNGSVSLSGEVIAEYNVTLTANPVAGGTVEGAGAYADGTSVMIVATANEGYNFVNWTENGEVVSDRSSYIFTVTADRDLVANFELNYYELTISGYTSNEDGWYLIASPIGSVSPSNVTNMIPSTAANYDLYSFDQTAELEWLNYKQGRFTNLEPGKGYLYANKETVTLRFTGMPYTGTGTFSLVYSTANADANMHGWNLVGNPFTERASIGNRSFYVMNNGGEIIAADRDYIEAMEGIFVVAENTGENVTFTTASSKAASSEIVMNLTSNQGRLIDRAIVNFDEISTLPKFQLHENSTKIYIPQDGKDYAVAHGEGMGEMPISFKPENNGSYTISVNAKNVEVSYMHLIDNLTGDDIDLLKTQTYTFNARISDYASRFKLVYIIGQIASDDFFTFNNNGNWIISNEGEATLQMIDVNGHVLFSEHISGTVTKHIEAASGVYIMRLINGTDEKTQKIVVK